jgi:hypothetical protein
VLFGEPRLFFTAPGYDGWPPVRLRLAEVDGERLEKTRHRCVADARPGRARRELDPADGV